MGSCTCSKREGTMLEIFIKNGGQTLSRSMLLLKVWGPDSDVEEGNLDNYIYFVRRRLKAVGSCLKLEQVQLPIGPVSIFDVLSNRISQ